MAYNNNLKNKKNFNDRINRNIMRLRNLQYQYDPYIFQDKIKKVFEIDRQNMLLMKNLDIIRRSKGRVDCWRTEIFEVKDFTAEDMKNKKIMSDNRKLYEKIQSCGGEYSVAHMKQDWKIQRMYSKKKKKPVEKSSTPTVINGKNKSKKTHQKKILQNPKVQKYPQCFFELQVVSPARKLGRLVFELYIDIVPKTCDNFIQLCKNMDEVTYKNTKLHHIISGYLYQGDDIENFNRSSGKSIYGKNFVNKNFILKHDTPGILSICILGKGPNDSKFNLTLEKLEILDGKNVAFGRVIKGLPILQKIDAYGTKYGKPYSKIIISECGLC